MSLHHCDNLPWRVCSELKLEFYQWQSNMYMYIAVYLASTSSLWNQGTVLKKKHSLWYMWYGPKSWEYCIEVVNVKLCFFFSSEDSPA